MIVHVQHTPEECPGRPCSDDCDHVELVDDLREGDLAATAALVALAIALSSVLAFWLGISFERRRCAAYREATHDRAVVDLGLCQDALKMNNRILSDLWPGWGRNSWSEPMPVGPYRSTPTPSPKDDLE